MASTLSTPRGARSALNDADGNPIKRLSTRSSSGTSATTTKQSRSSSSSTKRHPLRLFRRSSQLPKTTPNGTMEEVEQNDSTMRLEDDEAVVVAVENVVQWLQVTCPQDVLPKVLAFCGPQTTLALAKTSRFFRSVMQKEGTWRVFCEELYKWKHGDEEPESWAEHYRMTPCVPVDYSTVHKALEVACAAPPNNTRRCRRTPPLHLRHQVKPIRILLRPGNHYLKETILIESHAAGPVVIQAAQLPENVFRPSTVSRQQRRAAAASHDELPEGPQQLPSSAPTTSRTTLIRNLLRCHKETTVDETANDITATSRHRRRHNYEQQPPYHFSELERRNSLDCDEFWSAPPRRACLVFKSKRSNEPAIRVRQGSVVLEHVDVAHHSDGLDIWNGNAAIQVQPPHAEDGMPMIPLPPLVQQGDAQNLQPTAVLTGVHVTSATGRGIVNIDGGRLVLRSSAVTDCAATGVYIGGPGSHASMEKSDVLRNGLGNQTVNHNVGRRMGIARGHSGVYLEQGVARIMDCNISRNTLTGISVVSPDNASLMLEECDLMSNGTNQLEMPQAGSWARQQSFTRHNQLSVLGRGRTRSGLATVEQQHHHRSTSDSSLARRQPPQPAMFMHHHY